MSMPEAPLTGLRIVDLTAGPAAQTARILADLGADVLLVEPPAGSPSRREAPRVGTESLAFALRNANKRSVVLDGDDERDRLRFLDLVAGADIVIDSGNPGQSALFGTSCEELADTHDRLVVMSITDFGTTGPRSSWTASDPVLYALSSVLSRSGPPGGTPVLPPDGIASATAAAQAAWAVLVAHYQRLRTGRGDYVDFSRYEGVLQALDPPFGSHGQAAAARGINNARRDRPRAQDSYPIFACRDGWVRICILAPRQWRAMRAWLGEPEQFQDERYDSIAARAAEFDQIGAAITALFAQHSMAELVASGAERGVPIAAVLTPRDVLSQAHFQVADAWTALELTDAGTLTVPDGCVVLDGARAGIRWAAPAAGSSAPAWLADPVAVAAEPGGDRPLSGITILDLGVIVAGGELGRLFGDLGAEVIKVESPSYPDGLRQTKPGQSISESFAWTHRNQSALGIDLRNSRGTALFGELVAKADAVFANFKPGTLTSLGLSYDALAGFNPEIVLTESSAYGDTGPWSARLGYGPLVRSSTGITQLWQADGAHHQFYDAVTVFPDHLVARLAAVATLGALIRRDRTGQGAHIHLSQAESATSQLDVTYASTWARESGTPVVDDPAVHGVYPCQGDDEWCAITIGADADWAVIASAFGREDLADDPRFVTAPGRWESRQALRDIVAEYTSGRSPLEIATALQQLGVPAGPMNRGADVLGDPQVRHRQLYTEMVHPLLDWALPSETRPALYRHIAAADLRPAPRLGEHTREVCLRMLGLSDDEIDQLITDRVLHAAPATTATLEGQLP
ncbi:crotonobetainyl-CoA:carnitine CoA-transferase CaiB-like acyl-CoA transferase [Mycolicibacterium sp. BK634]|uniref:CaiB/BaiF CoA transferase family protein n=1 Tax=Mycolicibacterium sp. BK634 TaxID=2587099 RepID=UPI0017FB5F2B|nr:crotonobetainyl-CoA:carnitine CoA-transferase CaiB-like acyl-CoA transferase [Mycolicibacterium sp. BK634]